MWAAEARIPYAEEELIINSRIARGLFISMGTEKCRGASDGAHYCHNDADE